MASQEESCIYVSSDGEDWSRLVTDFQLLVDPQFSAIDPGTKALRLTRGSGESETSKTTPELISRTELLAPYPNPFNPATTLEFTVKEAAKVNLSIYDLRGRKVRSIVDEDLGKGRYSYVWLGRDNEGRRAASGIYFAKLKVGEVEQTRKMTLIK